MYVLFVSDIFPLSLLTFGLCKGVGSLREPSLVHHGRCLCFEEISHVVGHRESGFFFPSNQVLWLMCSLG